MIKKYNRGMSLVEIVVAATIITTFLGALVGVYTLHMKAIFGSAKQVKAVFLAEETMEALKYLRNVSWSQNIYNLSTNTDYFLVWQNNRWEITTTNTFIDSLFERKFVLEDGRRDAQNNIIESGGTADINIKKITVSVSWLEGQATTTKVLKTYMANIFDN